MYLRFLNPDKWNIRRQKLFYTNYIAAHLFAIFWCIYSFEWTGIIFGLIGYFVFGKLVVILVTIAIFATAALKRLS